MSEPSAILPPRDNAAIDAAIRVVWGRVAEDNADPRDPTAAALFTNTEDDDADALGDLLDGLVPEDDVTLPALRAAARRGLQRGLWVGWTTAESLRNLPGYHAADAMVDTLARERDGEFRG